MKVLQRDFGAAEFQRVLGSAGYDGSVVVQARQSLDETRFLVETARQWSFIKGVIGWVDLADPELERQLDEFAGPILVGVRHVVQGEPEGFLFRPEILRGLKAVEQRGLVFDLLVLPGQLPEAARLVERFPGMQFVLDHLGKPMEGSIDAWRSSIGRLAEHPGVSVKLSGLFSESWPSRWDEPSILYFFETAFDLFGPNRVLAASNWPVSELAGPYTWLMRWLEQYVGRFSEEVQKRVLGENAVRIYGLNLDR
jgi:L-fuconolactonase